MWSSRLLLLLLALVGSSHAANTTWTIHGRFICPIKDHFFVHLIIFEDDIFPMSDDGISHVGFFESYAPHDYSIDARDDGDIVGGYEIYAWVIHECTSDGTRRAVGIELGDFEDVETHYDVHKDLDIADKGDVTKDIK